jgi:hypothetical protein
MDIVAGCRGGTQAGALMPMIVELRNGNEFESWDGGQETADVFDDAINTVVFVQRHTLVDRVRKQALEVNQMLRHIPGDVLHGKLRGLRFEDKILHMHVTGWTPAQHLLWCKGRHIAQRLCRLGMRQGRFSGTHERDTTTVARATEDFVVHMQAIEYIQDREGNLRSAQNVATKIKDHVCRTLTLAEGSREQTPNILRLQLHPEE